MNSIMAIFKASVPFSQKTHCTCITRTYQLMLIR